MINWQRVGDLRDDVGEDDFGVAAPGSSLSKLGQSGVPGPGNSKH